MKRNGYRLQHLIDQILEVSKLNADAIKLSLQPVSLVELTKQIIGQFQSKLEQEHITLTIDFNEIDEHLYIDVEAWERIIINLMNNAIKFSTEGGTITLVLRNNDTHAQFRIKDNGRGIPSEYHQKVFEYLYQMDGHKAAEGTGIGLFLVKGLIEEMGGSIELYSEKGDGAEFVISLKKGHSHFAAIHSVKNEPMVADNKNTETFINGKKEEGNPENIFSEQILIVEDNRDFRNYLKSILGDRYSVITASNGKKALGVLEKETPNLIISDVMMPAMNGLEFVNELRKKSAFKHLPVIFLSAKNMEIEIEEGLSTGADIYLSKPIRSNLLLTQIEAVLRRERILYAETKTPQNPTEPELKAKVREIVYRQMASTSLTANMLADSLYISRAKLYYEWKKVSEVSINDFINEIRITEGKVLIKERGFSVQEAANAVGFSNPNYFSTSFKKQFGYSPSEIKER